MRQETELAEERKRQKEVLDDQQNTIMSLEDMMQKRQANVVEAKEAVSTDNGFGSYRC